MCAGRALDMYASPSALSLQRPSSLAYVVAPLPWEVPETHVSADWHSSKMARSSSLGSLSGKPTAMRVRQDLAPKVPALTHSRSQKKFEEVAKWLYKQDEALIASKAAVIRKLATPSGNKAAMGDFFAAQDAAPTIAPQPGSKPVLPPIPKQTYNKKDSAMVSMTKNALNSRYSDMFKAFQFIDLDRSGQVGVAELRRALDVWNIPLDPPALEALIQSCDKDGDGQISYQEFVDALAQDTVAVAAMGKRGMNAMEAMGTHDVDPTFLGHGSKIKHAYSMS